MSFFFTKKVLSIFLAGIVILAALFLLYKTIHPDTPNWITTKVERGTVTELVSVSGFIQAKNTANLAFPASGVVTDVFVAEGSEVKKGDILATLASSQLVAQRNEASALLQSAGAQHSQLLAGPTTEQRTVTQQTLQNAERNLERITAEEAEKVANAKNTLRSSSLIAIAKNGDETAVAPTVTGTYACEAEGTYTLRVYASNAYSKYSYQITGLENGSSPVYTQQPAQLGSCGLYVQFDADSIYGNTEWTIAIPNKNSSVYVVNKNAYDLALQNQQNNVKAAEDALALAQNQAELANADPRGEQVTQSEAAIVQAQAKIAAIDAQIADRSIVAPFDGVITSVDILEGETATNLPVITLLASDAFELKARVPEIDVTKLMLGQKTAVVFDANASEFLTGKITYISPLATEIDGVAYFETTITLDEKPTWLRSGLNADIDITVGEVENVLRIPKRFLVTDAEGASVVLSPRGAKTATTSISVGFAGNDGFVEITGLNEGDTIVAP